MVSGDPALVARDIPGLAVAFDDYEDDAGANQGKTPRFSTLGRAGRKLLLGDSLFDAKTEIPALAIYG